MAPWREEVVLLMARRWSDAAQRDAQTDPIREESASHMVQRSSGAVTRGVPNQVQKKGGVCYRHRTKSQWYQHTPNNATCVNQKLSLLSFQHHPINQILWRGGGTLIRVDLEVYSYDKKTCCALDYAPGTSLPQPAPVVFSSICIWPRNG